MKRPIDHEQLSLFANAEESSAQLLQRPVNTNRAQVRTRAQSRKVMINPHLLAARRIAKKMRRLPDHSEAETRAGLAICAQLKAYLSDSPQP